MREISLAAAATAALLSGSGPALSEPSTERGEYLVTVMVCADCHSPQAPEGGPDLARALSGGIGFEMPGVGIFWAPNLTPDATGLAGWSADDIVAAVRTGVRPDGRELAPIMPWRFFARLSDEDAMSIALYLKNLAPIVNKVPDPVGPGQPAPAPYLTMMPAGTRAAPQG